MKKYFWDYDLKNFPLQDVMEDSLPIIYNKKI